LASLPQPDDDDDADDGDEITDGGEDDEYAGTPAATPPSYDDQSPPVITLSQGPSPSGPATSSVPPSPSQDFPLDIMNHDGLLTEVTEPSASEAPQE